MPLRFRPRLFTPDERELLRRAEGAANATDVRRLRDLRALLRRSRDAFRGRSQRQQREQRGRQEARARHASTSHGNTDAKLRTFVEALVLVDGRLAELEAATGTERVADARPAAKHGRDPAHARGKRHLPPLPDVPRGSRPPVGPVVHAGPPAANRAARLGVTSALGRRNQARRDGRH